MPPCNNYDNVDDILRVSTPAGLPSTAPLRYVGRLAHIASTDQWVYYNGTGWVVLAEPTQSYTPSIANVTLGAGGVILGNYHRNDGWVDFQIYAALGSSGFAVSNTPIVGLPFAYATGRELESLVGLFYDSSAGGRFQSFSNANTTTTIALNAVYTASTFASAAAPGPTNPFTWASGDAMLVSGRYQMGTRHTYT